MVVARHVVCARSLEQRAQPRNQLRCGAVGSATPHRKTGARSYSRQPHGGSWLVKASTREAPEGKTPVSTAAVKHVITHCPPTHKKSALELFSTPSNQAHCASGGGPTTVSFSSNALVKITVSSIATSTVTASPLALSV